MCGSKRNKSDRDGVGSVHDDVRLIRGEEPSTSQDCAQLGFIIGLMSMLLFALGVAVFMEKAYGSVYGSKSIFPVFSCFVEMRLLVIPLWFILITSSLIIMVVFRRHYLYTYCVNDGIEHDTNELDEKSKKPQWVSLDFIQGKHKRLSYEYLVNCLVNPKAVFRRVTDYLSPSARTMAVSTRLTIANPESINLEYRRKKQRDKERLIIPVAFHKRGELSNRLRIYDNDGKHISTMSTRKVSSLFCDILDAFFSKYGGDIKWKEIRHSYEDQLAETTKPMKRESSLHETVIELIEESSADNAIKGYLKKIVVASSENYILCICIDDNHFKVGAWESYSLLVEMRLPLYLIKRDILRPLKHLDTEKPLIKRLKTAATWAMRIVNDFYNGASKSSGMFYYGLSNACLTNSYHLLMLGPEDTFCARADVLQIPYRYKKKDLAKDFSFKCEVLRGQRHSHILIRKSENYQNAVFMFHYIGRPQDMFFAAGLLALVGLVGIFIACLSANAFSSYGILERFFVQFLPAAVGQSSINTDIPALLLLVLSAVCPWLYDQGRSDRTESFLLDAATVITTFSSLVGLILYLDSAFGLSLIHPVRAHFLWLTLVVGMGCITYLLLSYSFLHSALYKALRLRRIDRYKEYRLKDFAKAKPARRQRSDTDMCEEPAVGCFDWPRGWLAMPGTFWWEHAIRKPQVAERVTKGAHDTTHRES